MSSKKKELFSKEDDKEKLSDLLRLEWIINELHDIRTKLNITDEIFIELFGYKNGTETVELNRGNAVKFIKK